MRKLLIFLLPVLVAVFSSGCALLKSAARAGLDYGASQAGISTQDVDSGLRVGKSVISVFDRFTPKQEYYVGRAVGASLMEQYDVFDNAALHRYVNLVGQSLAFVSDKPTTFRGYRFLVLDTDEVNAFAVPGGTILITRGLLKCCKTEDELAAVLAHEVAHIQHRHCIKSIRKSRLTEAFAIIGTEAAREYSGEEVAALAQQLEGSVADMTGKMFSGYDKDWEYEADASAIVIMKRMGYDPAALRTMLGLLAERTKGKKSGFGESHPKPKDRIKRVNKLLSPGDSPKPAQERQARFNKAMEGV